MKNQWDDAVCSAGFSFRGGEIIDKDYSLCRSGYFWQILDFAFCI